MSINVDYASTHSSNRIQPQVFELEYLAKDEKSDYYERVDSILQQFERAYEHLTDTAESIIKKRVTERLKFLKISRHHLDVSMNIYDITIGMQFLDIERLSLEYPFEEVSRVLGFENFISIKTIVEALVKLKGNHRFKNYFSREQQKILLEGLLQRTDKENLSLEERVQLHQIFSPKKELRNKVDKFVKERISDPKLRELSSRELKKLTQLKINFVDLSLVKLCPLVSKLDLSIPSSLKIEEISDTIFKTLAGIKLAHLQINLESLPNQTFENEFLSFTQENKTDSILEWQKVELDDKKELYFSENLSHQYQMDRLML